MLKLIALMITLFYSTASLANCSKAVQYLIEGQQAPCTGYLFSPDKELELRILNEDYKILLERVNLYLNQKALYKKELEQTEIIITKEREKAEVWRKLAEDTTLKYNKEQASRELRDWLLILGGVALTVGAGYAVGQAK